MRTLTWVLILTVACAAGCQNGTKSIADPGAMTADASDATSILAALVSGPDNLAKKFTPKIESKLERWDRHVPIIYSTTGWGPGKVQFEVPEYVHVQMPGEKRNAIIFSGRSLKVAAKLGAPKLASLETPVWKAYDGKLSLDTPLAGDVTIRFRIIPHDRMLEVRWGLSNAGDKPLRYCWTQLCFKGWMDPILRERLPLSSWMLGKGKLISWDAAGQDLTWVPAERRPDGRFKRSCFFRARIGKGLDRRGRVDLRPGKSARFHLGRKVDIPAMAKADARQGPAAIVYSPTAKDVFYNFFQPCFHADPFMGEVPPKSTRWTQTYLIFFKGDVEKFMNKLAGAHKQITGAK